MGQRTVEDRTRPQWVSRPERGSLLAMHLIAWIALRMGRGAARLLLYPICLYFLFFAGAARRASRDYLRRVLGHAPGPAGSFRHFHTFASTILDRVFLLNGRVDRFDVRVHGQAAVEDVLAGGGGCFLLGAHMGSFEIVRALGAGQRGLEVSLLMYEENARKLASVFDAINPRHSQSIIALGEVDTMLKVDALLARGGLAGMLADRTIGDEPTLPHRFLGAQAAFPAGPFRLAAVLRRPVVVMFGLYRGGNRYDIHFERLDEGPPAPREERLRRLQAQYVARLEHYCRSAPYNWFNFYDFWG